jgi:predicted dehydrogenase
MVHAPGLAHGDGTALAGVWARRAEAAGALAATYGVPSFTRVEDLFAACDAVAFSVPPGVQAELGVLAARAGKALLLEKPIAADLAGAERLASAVADAGVPSMVVLTWRYAPQVRSFLESARDFKAIGGRGWFISGALRPGSPFATPWRLERGPLLDLGPHVLDLMDAALGPITGVRAHGGRLGWVGVHLEHESGAHSDVSLCGTANIDPHLAGAELFGEAGSLSIDPRGAARETIATLFREFALVARGQLACDVDVHRGLYLQRFIEAAEGQLS